MASFYEGGDMTAKEIRTKMIKRYSVGQNRLQEGKLTREELKQIYYINKEIKMWQRELDRLQCKSLIGSQNLDGLPRGNSTSDKTADLAMEREEVETIIEGKLAEIQVQRKKIMEYINNIDDSLTRQIVYLYNVSCMKWREVAGELNSTENCVKQIYSRHFRGERNK